MSDVRLTATNPDDSSVIPVACNARGELLTVAPVIEKIPNDVEIEGDLTVTGTINGDSGGSGLPAPGPEGSILAIENGAPAWVGKSDLCAPPEPQGDQVIFTPGTGSNPFGGYEENGQLNNVISDYNAWLKTLSSWDEPGVDKRMGFGNQQKLTGSFNLEVKEAFGKVLSIQTAMFIETKTPSSTGAIYNFELSQDSFNVNDISKSTSVYGNSTTLVSMSHTFSYLISRDNISVNFSSRMSGNSDSERAGTAFYIQKFWLEDQLDYLMRRQIMRSQSVEVVRNARRDAS